MDSAAVTTRFRQPLMRCLFAALALALAAPWGARAQLAQPPEASVAAADSLSPQAVEQIAAFVTARAGGLTGDPAELKRTRDDVLRPLTGQRVSVAFRLEYAKQLGGHLEKAAASSTEQPVINALRIAGELAAPRGIALLTRHLTDARAAIRYAAAFGVARFFDASGRTGPAASPDQLGDLLKAVATQSKAEKDAFVIDGLAQALSAAARVPESAVRGLRAPAVSALAELASVRAGWLAAAPGDPGAGHVVETLFRVCGALRGALTDVQQVPLPAEARSACSATAAALLNAAAAVEKAGSASPVAPAALKQLTRAAEGVRDYAK